MRANGSQPKRAISALAMVATIVGVWHLNDLAARVLAQPQQIAQDVVPTEPTPTEKEFIGLVRKAIAGKDPQLLVDRTCWDGVDAGLREFLNKACVDAIQRGVDWFEFERVDPREANRRRKDGKIIVPNLPTQWRLSLHHRTADGVEITTRLFAGEKEGKIFLTNKLVRSQEGEPGVGADSR